MKPTTGAARFPFGTTRLESAIREIPGRRPRRSSARSPARAGGPGRRSPSAGAARRQGRRRNVDDGRQRQGGLHGMRDLEVVGHDVIGGNRDGQRRPVAVVDAATQRGQRHRDGGLAARRRLVRAGMQDLDVDQSGHDEQHGHEEHHAHEPHPAREGAALPPAPLARQRVTGRPWPASGADAAVVVTRSIPPRRRDDAVRRAHDAPGRTPGEPGEGSGWRPDAAWRRTPGPRRRPASVPTPSWRCSDGLNQRARGQARVGS